MMIHNQRRIEDMPIERIGCFNGVLQFHYQSLVIILLRNKVLR